MNWSLESDFSIILLNRFYEADLNASSTSDLIGLEFHSTVIRLAAIRVDSSPLIEMNGSQELNRTETKSIHLCSTPRPET